MSVTVLVEVLLAVLVVFGVAVAATGRLGDLRDVPADDAGTGLPAGRLAGPDLQSARFPLAFRGYRMAEVDDVLVRLAGELATRDAEIDRLRGGPLAATDPPAADPPPAADHPAPVDHGGPVTAPAEPPRAHADPLHPEAASDADQVAVAAPWEPMAPQPDRPPA